MSYIAQRYPYRGAEPRTAEEFTDIEVVDGRVTGIRGRCRFNVKLQSGMRFFLGSGSGKITYHLKTA